MNFKLYNKKEKPRLLLLPILTLLFLQTVLFAQTDSTKICNDCSCQSDLSPSGIMISHVHKKHEMMISYRFMTMNMDGMKSGTSSVSDEAVFKRYLMSSDRMKMDMHMLMLMYGISNRLTVMGMFNYNLVSMNMKMLPGSSHEEHGSGNSTSMNMKTNGIGDPKLYLMYELLTYKNHRFVLSTGISLPAGALNLSGKEDSMYPNQRLPYNMQMGSGTWDLLPSLTYLFQKNRLAVSTQVTSVLRTGYNSEGYKLGNEYTSNTWLSFKWFNAMATSLRFEASSVDHIYGKDKKLYAFYEPAARALNYGGNRVMSYVGLKFIINRGVLTNNSLGFEYGLPIFQQLNGPQMALKNSINASWSFMF